MGRFASSFHELIEFRKNLWKIEAGNQFSDCSLSAEGKVLNAHRVVLSAASPYFKNIFSAPLNNHGQQCPILIFESLTFASLQNLIRFVYEGEVSLASQDEMNELMKTLDFFHIKISPHQFADLVTTEETPALKSSPRPSTSMVQFIPPAIHVKSERLKRKVQTQNNDNDDEESSQERKTFFKLDKRKKIQSKISEQTRLSKNESVAKSPIEQDLKEIKKLSANIICIHCSKSFFVTSSCKKHENTCKMNLDRERFICPECGSELARKDTLKNHMTNVHKK